MFKSSDDSLPHNYGSFFILNDGGISVNVLKLHLIYIPKQNKNQLQKAKNTIFTIGR